MGGVAYRIVVIVIGLLALGGGFLASAEARWDDQPADTETTTTTAPPATTPLSTAPPATDPPTTEPEEEEKDRGNGDSGRERGNGGDEDDD